MNINRKAKKAYEIGNYYFYNKGNYEKALINYVRSMKSKSSFILNEKVLYLIGECYWCLGMYEHALAYAEKSLEISGGYLDALYLKGVILKKIGKENGGEKILQKHAEIIAKIEKQDLDLEAFYNEK